MKQQYSLSKDERLNSNSLITKMFTRGGFEDQHVTTCYPLLAVYLIDEAEETQMLVSVPKKAFKHAVDRNRIKRQVREAYRFNKEILSSTKKLSIAFIWMPKEHMPSEKVNKAMKKILKHINNA